MEHFTDPILSRIQSSVESQLRREAQASGHDNVNQLLAQHPHLHDVTRICAGLQDGRRNPLRRFSTRRRKAELASMDPDCQCMDFYTRLVLCHLYGDHKKYRGLKREFEFSTCDPKWFEAIDEYFSAFGPGSDHSHIPYVPWEELGDFVQPDLPNNLSIGILGDWGTGEDIAVDMLQRVVAQDPDIILHLGDVYYAGTAEEYDHKLHALVDRYAVNARGEPIPFLTMPGNHDMYAGGRAYYDSLQRLSERSRAGSALQVEQQASYFCLRLANNSWQLLAMDTAYHDHNPFMVDSGITRVRHREEQWLQDKIRNFSGQTILLSHHQPYSPYEPIGAMSRKKPSEYYRNPDLMGLYQRLRAGAAYDIPLWIWGHEHNLGIYQPYAGISRGRCVGHSAVPVLRENNPYAVRKLSGLEFLDSLLGLVKGRWGRRPGAEFAELLRLAHRSHRVETPELTTHDGKAIKLGLSPDDNMYRHGFAMMQFREESGHSDLTVEYYDDVDDKALYSDRLAGIS